MAFELGLLPFKRAVNLISLAVLVWEDRPALRVRSTAELPVVTVTNAALGAGWWH